MSKSFEVIFREFADSETFVLSRGLLEDYKRQAAQEERERIIKLLEAEMEHALGDDGRCLYTNHYREVCNCDMIALIKEENK